MPRTIDIKNKRSGKLIAIEPTGELSKQNDSLWFCACDCGNIIKVRATLISQQKSKSCGLGSCHGMYKHGKAGTNNYRSERRNILKERGCNSWQYKGLHQKLKEKINYCCYCGSKSELEIEHIIPVTKGGNSEISNLTLACKACNSSKNNKLFSVWYGTYKNGIPKMRTDLRNIDLILKDLGFDSWEDYLSFELQNATTIRSA